MWETVGVVLENARLSTGRTISTSVPRLSTGAIPKMGKPGKDTIPLLLGTDRGLEKPRLSFGPALFSNASDEISERAAIATPTLPSPRGEEPHRGSANTF